MATILPTPPKIGMVSLGCPKNLVDSERILTQLRGDGYQMSPDYAGADVVLVNTCGFLDSAKEESLEAIGEAIAERPRHRHRLHGQGSRGDPRALPAGARDHRCA
jgi:ribosomal protein S12 methylthiotransferase